jgi:ribose transport system permease protein
VEGEPVSLHVRFNEVVKDFGPVRVLHGVNFELEPGPAPPSTGLLWELEAIAAVIVGGTALKGGQGRIRGTVIGAVLLSVIGNILNLTSIISVYLNAAVQGFVIIVVAFLQRGRR